ncbi:sulfur oxidation c-type cytochrome SoxX [Aurantimonas sp. 22II-16-19i]|uniref:sulfur oxidation c-type cytochrome SoxX n=1 Tax=Aurantimonas sp. 22II-16-19i TaxID=1317114 RepID=UPI0009F7B657|nr:sulfur oxidation c-type cytochrome SoxX [Aurantimonas sp. 22II-16-19i]ORE99210.1 Monoheme cytochrome c SoxX [Aurantimonas sp. 22II-16-19i]
MNRICKRSVVLVALFAAAPAAAETAPGAVAVDDMAVAQPISEAGGDPVAGRKVFADRGLGNCLACHVNADLKSELFQGTVGPALDGVGDRWEAAQLRAIVVNAKTVFGPETMMPGFYSLDVGVDVAEEFKDKTILSAKDVEDVVAYLTTLKGE